MSSGLYSSRRLPTALADRMYSTPSVFMPKMLARKFSSDGKQAMSGAVPGEKGHAAPAQRAEHVGTGRSPEGRLERDLAAVGDFRHVVQTTAADDADLHLFHRSVSFVLL